MDRASLIAGGIFSRENGQRLLQIAHLLTMRAFSGLYDKCEKDVKGKYYQTGLKRVHEWSNDIIDEDIHYLRQSCTDLDETFASCFYEYIQERMGKKRATVNCPTLQDFVRRFLECVGLHECLVSAEYFTKRDILMQRVTCMDAIRQALYTLVTVENLRVELQSDVTSNLSKLEKGDEPTNRAQGSILEHDEIHPSDSVSNIGPRKDVASQINGDEGEQKAESVVHSVTSRHTFDAEKPIKKLYTNNSVVSLGLKRLKSPTH